MFPDDRPASDRSNRQKEKMFDRKGKTQKKPRHRLAGPTWGKVVSREHEADRLARIAEPGDENRGRLPVTAVIDPATAAMSSWLADAPRR